MTEPTTRFFTENNGEGLEMSFVIAASQEKIFDAWTQPEMLLKWMRKDGVKKVVSATSDLRPGGSYELEMEVQGGSVRISGEYLAIDRSSHLSFTWRAPFTGTKSTTVSVDLEPGVGGTLMRITHTGFTAREHAKRNNRGWADMVPYLITIMEEGHR